MEDETANDYSSVASHISSRVLKRPFHFGFDTVTARAALDLPADDGVARPEAVALGLLEFSASD